MQLRPLRSLRVLTALAFAVFLSGEGRAQITHLEALSLDGAQQVPPVATGATGRADITVNTFSNTVKYNVTFSGLSSAQSLAHIHGPAAVGANGAIMFTLPLGSPCTGSAASTPTQAADILASLSYSNIHTANFGNGEIRGQYLPSPPIGTSLCFGDGTGTACPCANSGAPGHGCENSASTGGALLKATGHNSPDNVVLISTNEKPSVLTVFLSGTASVGPFLYGDGLRCVGGTQKRLAAKSATGGAVAYPEGAELSISARSAALGSPITPGTHRFYMAFYRDNDLTFCPGAEFNSSNTVDILW